MPTYADLVSHDIMSEGEKQILCGALAIGNAALSHWLIFRQGPRLIELAGSIVISMTQQIGQAVTAGVGAGGALPTAMQEAWRPGEGIERVAGAVNPFKQAGGPTGSGGSAQVAAQVLPFLV